MGAVFIQLIASAPVLPAVLGQYAVMIGFAAFAVFIYCQAVSVGEDGARRVLGWVGGPRKLWVGAALAGTVMGAAITGITAGLGHSIRVVEPIPGQILAVTLGPIVEEICVRGVLLRLLARALGGVGAILVTSALFAVLHWPASILKLGCIAVTGAVYGYVVVRFRSTALAAVAHTAHNAAILAFGVIANG